jgi:hypothetical protein
MFLSTSLVCRRLSSPSLFLRALALAGGLALAGCGPYGLSRSGGETPGAAAPEIAGALAGASLGSGATRIALIVPLSQSDGSSLVGQSLRNAAELALSEVGENAVTILIKDDQSSPDGARRRRPLRKARKSSSARFTPTTCAKSDA